MLRLPVSYKRKLMFLSTFVKDGYISLFSQQFQRKCLHGTGQYGGRQVENTWLMRSLMTQTFTKWSTLGMELSSIQKQCLFHTQRWDFNVVVSRMQYSAPTVNIHPYHTCYIRLYLSQAGSPLTKVKLFVIDTTNPTRRTQVFPPASVASGSVYSSFHSIT